MAATGIDDFGGWKATLEKLVAGEHLTSAHAGAATRDILSGTATPSQIAGFLVALRAKGADVAEVVGITEAMLEEAAPIALDAPDSAIDIVGTGGAPSRRTSALNVSTMASFVAAGAGAQVCKHGNRRASSTSGSFDLLEALGVAADLDGDAVAACVREVGIGFCFARAFHPALRHAAPVRADLGIPTVFNLIGPLCHPAGVQRQVIGVASQAAAELVVGVLGERQVPLAWVVHGHGDLDELSLTGPSTVNEVRHGAVTTMTVDPAELGLTVVEPEALHGGTPAQNAALAHRIFAGHTGPVADIVALNAAAGLVVAEVAGDLSEGLALARRSMTEGAAASKLAAMVARS